jgi:integrase
VDFDADRIIVYRSKTDTGFAIPVYPQLRPLLEKLCENRKPNEYLFGIGAARTALRNACRRLELPPFSLRSLRRMFVVRALEKGIDVKTVSEWQGHRDGGTLILRTYSHVRPVHSQRMAALMSDEQPPNVVPISRQVVE